MWNRPVESSRVGQSTLEYAAVGAAIAAALLAMQIYIKRGISGKLRTGADSIGEQYAPNSTTSDMTMRETGTTTTRSDLVKGAIGGTIDVMRTTIAIAPGNPQTVTRTGWEDVGPFESNLFD